MPREASEILADKGRHWRFQACATTKTNLKISMQKTHQFHVWTRVQVPPSPLGGSDRFRPTIVQRRLNRRISINSAVFSYLKISTQDRNRTEKRPLRTLIRYILVTRNPDMGLCNECVTKMSVIVRCSATCKRLTRTQLGKFGSKSDTFGHLRQP